MSEGVEPDWALLPSQPAQFFGLPVDFERSDLKRAYNRLLKVYKPERHPEQFQKIRAAYEALEGRFGGGGTASQSPQQFRTLAVELGQPPASATTADGRPAVGTLRLAPSLAARALAALENSDRSELESLYAQKPALPEDYAALAALCDVLQPKRRFGFLGWILRGRRAHPSSGLLRLTLAEHLKSQAIDDSEIAGTLRYVSRVITDDGFFILAAPLLRRLAKVVPWEQYRQVYDECASRIHDRRVDARLHFEAAFLRLAVWVAPVEECRRMLAEVEARDDRIDSTIDDNLEIVRQLLDYREHRDWFLGHGPIAERIDNAIRRYCFEGRQAAADEVSLVQRAVVSRPEDVLAAFGEATERQMGCLEAWGWISFECESDKSLASDRRRAAEATRAVIIQIDRETLAVPFVLLYIAGPLSFGPSAGYMGPAIDYVVTTYFGPAVVGYIWMERIKIAMVAGIFLFGASLAWLYYALIWRRTPRRRYRWGWRGTLAQFFLATRLRHHEVATSIEALATDPPAFRCVKNLHEYFRRDLALKVYAIAVHHAPRAIEPTRESPKAAS